MGYLGSLSQDPLGRIFSKCVFLNLLNSLGLPIPSNAMEASKKIPRGCEIDELKELILAKVRVFVYLLD